ncbi:hypothetical protein BKA81DRAFT_383298 [Phyllosticta paracitricarpa]|uniref:Uncharacterized protein n=1 Tax=Phyllosticta paracitricarpa TaxID=2016321 RepID=A0ABR1MS36_9PEZI
MLSSRPPLRPPRLGPIQPDPASPTPPPRPPRQLVSIRPLNRVPRPRDGRRARAAETGPDPSQLRPRSSTTADQVEPERRPVQQRSSRTTALAETDPRQLQQSSRTTSQRPHLNPSNVPAPPSLRRRQTSPSIGEQAHVEPRQGPSQPRSRSDERIEEDLGECPRRLHTSGSKRQRKPRRTLPLEPEYEAKYQRLLAERRRPLGLESSFDSILRQAPVEPQQRPQTSAQGADIDLTGLQEPRRQEPFQLSPHASVPVEEDFDPRRHRSSGSIRQRKSRRSLPADPTLLTTTRKASIYEPRQPLQQAAPIESHQQEADRPPSRSGPQFVEEDEWPPHIPSDLPVRVGFRRLYQLDAALAFENDPILASMIEQALAERSQPRPRSKPPPSDVKHEYITSSSVDSFMNASLTRAGNRLPNLTATSSPNPFSATSTRPMNVPSASINSSTLLFS